MLKPSDGLIMAARFDVRAGKVYAIDFFFDLA